MVAVKSGVQDRLSGWRCKLKSSIWRWVLKMWGCRDVNRVKGCTLDMPSDSPSPTYWQRQPREVLEGVGKKFKLCLPEAGLHPYCRHPEKNLLSQGFPLNRWEAVITLIHFLGISKQRHVLGTWENIGERGPAFVLSTGKPLNCPQFPSKGFPRVHRGKC